MPCSIRGLSRRLLAALALSLAVAPLVTACGGGTVATLRALGKPSGEGPARMTVKNESGVGVQQLYVARTDVIDEARARGVEPGSAEDEALWGDDHLDRTTLLEGSTSEPIVLQAGRYDVLAIDPDRREQLVKGLRLKPGGKYTLLLGDAWALAR
jgi:hypothetical protein